MGEAIDGREDGVCARQGIGEEVCVAKMRCERYDTVQKQEAGETGRMDGGSGEKFPDVLLSKSNGCAWKGFEGVGEGTVYLEMKQCGMYAAGG